MVSTYSDRLHLELQADGENAGTWGTIANTQFQLLEEAIAGVATVTHDDSASYVITTPNGAAGGSTTEGRNMVLELAGTLTANRNLEVPTEEKIYLVKNGTSGGFDVTVKTNAGSGVSVPNGTVMMVYCDGTDVVNAITALPSGTTVGDVTVVDLSSVQTLVNKIFTVPLKINDTSADHTYTFAVSELAADRTVTLPLLTGNDTFVFADHIQTLTNKTLTSPVLTTPQINDTSADHQYVFAVSELTADRTVTLPLLTGDDDFVFEDHIQTLTQKTLKDTNEAVNALGSISGANNLDFSLGHIITATLTGATTFTITNYPSGAGSFTLILTNPSTNITWADTILWAGGTEPTWTTTGVDILTLMTPDSGTTWYGFLSGLDMS